MRIVGAAAAFLLAFALAGSPVRGGEAKPREPGLGRFREALQEPLDKMPADTLRELKDALKTLLHVPGEFQIFLKKKNGKALHHEQKQTFLRVEVDFDKDKTINVVAPLDKDFNLRDSASVGAVPIKRAALANLWAILKSLHQGEQSLFFLGVVLREEAKTSPIVALVLPKEEKNNLVASNMRLFVSLSGGAWLDDRVVDELIGDKLKEVKDLQLGVLEDGRTLFKDSEGTPLVSLPSLSRPLQFHYYERKGEDLHGFYYGR